MPDLVVPMPLHTRRRWRRGFNHATPIARSLAETLEVEWRPDALVRVRDTPPQAGLPEAARRRNVRGAFRARPRLGAHTRVWIVDDVLTTGSTLDAAADALLDAGIAEVYGLALAATHDARPSVRQSRTHPGLSRVEDPQGPESSVRSG